MTISLPSGTTTLFPLQFKRQEAAPIDLDAVFSTTLDRVDYLSNPRRYAGQVVVDLQDNKAYFLNSARSAWILMGSNGPAGASGPTGPAGANASTSVINTSVSLIASESHVNAIIRFNTNINGALTFTVTSTSGFTIGDTCVLTQIGVNTVTVVAGSGQTVLSPETLSIRKSNGKITVSYVAVNTWEIEGNLA